MNENINRDDTDSVNFALQIWSSFLGSMQAD